MKLLSRRRPSQASVIAATIVQPKDVCAQYLEEKLAEPRKLEKLVCSSDKFPLYILYTNLDKMRLLVCFVAILCAMEVNSQFWNYPQQFISTWLRQGKTGSEPKVTSIGTSTAAVNFTIIDATTTSSATKPPAAGTTRNSPSRTTLIVAKSIDTKKPKLKSTITSPIPSLLDTTLLRSTTAMLSSTTPALTTKMETSTEGSTIMDTTTHEVTVTTEESRDIHRTHEFYLSKREKPQVKIASNISQNLLPLPAGASAALVKPTKYHYYPHNQHIYLLPECAIQQVCNAVYVRLNWTQPLCACPSRYRDPCSASLNSDDQHTTELMTDRKSKRALTLVKTCEPTTEMRICRSPRDWSLLALQNIRTGKSHYLVICRCPEESILEGPMSHDQPTYASVPGIRVYGMMCVDTKRRGRPLRTSRSLKNPPFPWEKATRLAETAIWD